LDIINLMQ
jgi:hypothetical protein